MNEGQTNFGVIRNVKFYQNYASYRKSNKQIAGVFLSIRQGNIACHECLPHRVQG